MGKFKVGVIGTGHQGRHHVRIYHEMESTQLVGVCDTNPELGQKYADEFGAQFFPDYKSLAGEVDAVSVVVPTVLHHTVTSFFLNKGIHCMVEKPIAATLEEAEDLLRISKETNSVLQVGHVERFNRAVLKIAEFIRNPRYIESNRLGPFSPRVKDIGVVQDLMIHDVDIILNLVKNRVNKIEAVGLNVITEHEDIAHAHLIFDNGCIANLNASRLTNEATRKLRIFQEDLYISLDYARQEVQIQKLQGGNITKEVLPVSKEEPLRLELAHFINCIKERKSPIVSVEAGKDALGIVLDVLRNIQERRGLWASSQSGKADSLGTEGPKSRAKSGGTASPHHG